MPYLHHLMHVHALSVMKHTINSTGLENEQNSLSDLGLYIALESEKSEVLRSETLCTRQVE